jgi:NAD(P)-dependent dehydrogenase (short-subunit alcohol dehydrogenase family)
MALPHAPQAVITGAGSGFGRALALHLAARGARLVLSDVDEPGCKETERLALAAGAAAAKSVRCDVSKLEDVQALEAACEGDVDLVVNNAGVSSGGLIGEAPIEDWRWTLDIDLYGVIHGCHVFVPRLRKQGHGHVLNVASAAGLLTAPSMGAYNVAKAGVIALSETLSAEVSGTKIGVTVLCPTFFKTNIVKGGRFSNDKDRVIGQKLVDRGKTAEEIARKAIKSCEKNELYCVPMADGLWFWRLKRAAPSSYRTLAGMVASRMRR